MIVRRGLVLALVMLIASMASAYESQENREESFQRMSRRSEMVLLCGDRLSRILMHLCTNRLKRHAVPEPDHRVVPGNLSPFLMSIYRPSIDNDMTISEGDNWGYESPTSSRDRFQAVEVIRRLHKRSPLERGVTEVCCYKPCSRAELEQFC